MNTRPPFETHRKDLDNLLRVLQDTPTIDREYMAPIEEFQARVRRTNQALQHHGHTVGLVFSDEQYAGDVPYLGGPCRSDGAQGRTVAVGRREISDPS